MAAALLILWAAVTATRILSLRLVDLPHLPFEASALIDLTVAFFAAAKFTGRSVRRAQWQSASAAQP